MTTIPTNSCLDITVSCVQNYYSKYPKDVNLLTWLRSSKYAHVVQRIRATEDKQQRKRLKGGLPAITPSGRFSRVDEQHLLAHSGFIQFDIDGQDNPHIANYATLHHELRKLANIAYCGRSAGGNGWWGLVRIGYPDRHEAHWEYILLAMQRIGIRLDEAPKNVCALRGYSYDPDAYYNHHAPKLWHYLAPYHAPDYLSPQQQTTLTTQAEQYIARIEQQQVDVTDTYTAWFTIGCNFAASFGEEGRGYYHRVSRYHREYTRLSCDYQYNKCLDFVQQQKSNAGLGYFISRCRGIAA